MVGDAGDAAAARPHRRQQCPGVGGGIVHLRRAKTLPAVEAAGDVDLAWGQGREDILVFNCIFL